MRISRSGTRHLYRSADIAGRLPASRGCSTRFASGRCLRGTVVPTCTLLRRSAAGSTTRKSVRYAEYVFARADFTFPLPAGLDDVDIAPLLYAGIICFRSLRLAGVAHGERVSFLALEAPQVWRAPSTAIQEVTGVPGLTSDVSSDYK